MSAIEVPLSRGKVALISPEDAERVLAYKWCYDGAGYACRKETWRDEQGQKHTRMILLHRFIMGAQPGQEVDHENRHTLDCRRRNLRFATRSQNIANTAQRSGTYKGVSWHKRDKVWRAFITVNRCQRSLGQFKTPEAAAIAYDAAALAAWPEFAFLNFEHLRPLYQLAITSAKVPKQIKNKPELSLAAD